jgi:hypothetical protein
MELGRIKGSFNKLHNQLDRGPLSNRFDIKVNATTEKDINYGAVCIASTTHSVQH